MRSLAARVPNYPGPRAERTGPTLHPIGGDGVGTFGGFYVTEDRGDLIQRGLGRTGQRIRRQVFRFGFRATS
jgi:hypothetical protein